MYKYTIKAFNHDVTVGAVNVIRLVVQAGNEAQAIQLARQMADRTDYAVEQIENLKPSTTLQKLPQAQTLRKRK